VSDALANPNPAIPQATPRGKDADILTALLDVLRQTLSDHAVRINDHNGIKLQSWFGL